MFSTFFRRGGGWPFRYTDVHSPWNRRPQTRQPALCGSAESCSQGTVCTAVGSHSFSHGLKVSPREKEVPVSLGRHHDPVCKPLPEPLTELSWALPSLLGRFSNTILDIMGVSHFEIILCPSVKGLALIMSTSKCPPNGNILLQSPSRGRRTHSDFCHEPQSMLHGGLWHRELGLASIPASFPHCVGPVFLVLR